MSEGLTEKDLLAEAAAAAPDDPRLEQVLRALCGIAPTSPEYACQLGWMLVKLHRPAEAEAEFGRASARPGALRWEAYAGTGVALAMQERFAEAAVLLEKAVSKGVRIGLVNSCLLLSLNEQAQYDRASMFTAQWAKDRPHDADALFLHGVQLTRVGKFSEAAELQARAVALKPEAGAYAVSLAQTLAAAGQFKEAAELIYKLVYTQADPAILLPLWSHCLERAFDDAGEAFLLTHLQNNPRDPIARFELSQLYDRQGRWDLADAEIQGAFEVSKSPLLSGLAGRIAILQGNYPKAEELLHFTWQSVAQKLGKIPAEARERAITKLDAPLNPLLYMPVEIGSRELQTRLNIARAAIAAGFTVVLLGHQVFRIGLKHLPAGVIVYKSVSSLELHLVNQAAHAGHIFTAIDEEAFGRTGDSFAVMKNLDLQALDGCTALFAPGEAYKQGVVAHVPEAASKVIVTGNPRTDLCRSPHADVYREEAKALKITLGRTILFCTNFGGWNSAVHPYVAVCQTALGLPGVSIDSDRGKWLLGLSLDLASAECRNAAAVREAIPALAAAFPNHQIIIRPHPVEDANVWEHLASQATNVSVDSQASLHAQMMQADAVIHLPGCGTGLEAMLLGRPAICLNKVEDLEFPKLGISCHLSRTATDITALVALLGAAISDQRPFVELSPERQHLLDEWLARPDTPVCEVIVKSLVDIYDNAVSTKPRARRRQLPAGIFAKLIGGLSAAHKIAHVASFANIRLVKKRIQMPVEELRERFAAIPGSDGMRADVECPAEDIFVIRAR